MSEPTKEALAAADAICDGFLGDGAYPDDRDAIAAMIDRYFAGVIRKAAAIDKLEHMVDMGIVDIVLSGTRIECVPIESLTGAIEALAAKIGAKNG